MKIRVLPFVLVALTLIPTALGLSQTPRIIRWQESDPNSTQFLRDGVVIKHLIDVVDGIKVAVSIKEQFDTFFVNLEIYNGGQGNREIRPGEFQLQVLSPRSNLLRHILTDELARAVVASADSRAEAIELTGAFATKKVSKTVIEHVPVIPGVDPSITDPDRIVILKTPQIEVVQKTVTETVPDEEERTRSRLEASRIRSEARADARQIEIVALKVGSLVSQSEVSGRIYYKKTKEIQELLIRIPLGDLTVEIPFKAVKKRLLSGKIAFE